MINHELAKIFFEIGDILAEQGVAFKPQVYQQAAIALDELEKDVIDVYKENGTKSLMDLPCIGDSIAAKIEEYILTGKIKYYEELKKDFNKKNES
ncbi:MAG TPA: hypothetical protein PKM84_00185 [Candidatus Pacearchaeota archaeon]|nr:hypothetical protein [Candidatus Pacearchaeota archaeon]